jgi:hypothetical protein
MTDREKLHQLADSLSETELPLAVRILQALDEGESPLEAALADAPPDDEPDHDDDDGGLTEARNEASISHDEAKRRILG